MDSDGNYLFLQENIEKGVSRHGFNNSKRVIQKL